LYPNPVGKGAMVVAQMQGPGGPHSADDPFFLSHGNSPEKPSAGNFRRAS